MKKRETVVEAMLVIFDEKWEIIGTTLLKDISDVTCTSTLLLPGYYNIYIVVFNTIVRQFIFL